MDINIKAKQLLEEALGERPELFLIDFTISEDNDIAVVLDGDFGVKVEDVVFVSRKIEHNLDRDEVDFSLKVSSVDITEAFSLKRQYIKNIGRKVKVKTETAEIQGELIEVNDEDIVLEYKIREPKPLGKGKITVTKQDKIAFENIKEAKVVLNFK